MWSAELYVMPLRPSAVNESKSDDSLPQPPPLVVAATACMSVSVGAGLAKAAIFTAPWQRPATQVGFPLICLLFFLLFRALYRGRRWAFWCIVPLTALGVYHAPSSSYFASLVSTGDRITFVAQSVLQFAAVVCLLFPSSRRWFFPKGSRT